MNGTDKLHYKKTHSSYYMNKLDDVFSWLENKGINVRVSRYSRYKAYIDDFYKTNKPYDLYDLEQKFMKLNEAVQECVQIVQIYDSFINENSIGFNERLKKIISGTDFYNSETKSDQPRDFLYELLVASWFKSCKYDIDFDKITDVVAKKNDTIFYVECKRIKSVNGLEQNLKKACKQLSKVDDSKNHHGVIFMDIYNCVSDKIKSYEYPNIFEIRNELNNVLENNFRKQNSELIDRILTQYLDCTLGVFFTTVHCFWLKDVTPQFYQDCKGITSHDLTKEKFNIFNKIFDKSNL